jgi:hypothetical protein
MDVMGRFRRAVIWAALMLIILGILLSVYGAFVGTDRAKRVVNTLPSALYWLGFAFLLVVGILTFRRLVAAPPLLFIHAGCILVLTGSMYASPAGHRLQKRLFGINKIVAGQMPIYEGETENAVFLEGSDEIKKLPFSIRLKDFRIEYYQPGHLLIEARGGEFWRIPVEIGREYSLGPAYGKVKIVRAFENLKVIIEAEEVTIIDSNEPGHNPALHVELTSPQGNLTRRYVFERTLGHSRPEDRYVMSYQRVISDYVSELEIIKDAHVIAEKEIEVNHPLHFGGYHFYQHSYDAEAAQYSVLMVASDSGLGTVYLGYWMLCMGVFWHFWVRPALPRVRAKSLSRAKPRDK